MAILAALFLLWIFVTLVGHGSYVIVRALFRVGFDESELKRFVAPSKQSDLAAARRVILKLVERDLLSPQEMSRLHHGLDDLARPTEPLPDPTIDSTEPLTPIADLVDADLVDADLVDADLVDADLVGSLDEPILAVLVTEEETEPDFPAISKAEVIRSFLAARNIRWGELVAGMLIVVCSIGLVVSLWNTFAEHRFVPSMIFLGANAAIYATGFYTLSRWRLRHTSRAVLAIATLLVPLTVLAGVAAAGTNPETVQLTDPLTLATLALAGSLYSFLLYRGGKSLARRPYAFPIFLSVAGPVACVPLIPAAIRNMGVDAGWVVGTGSIAVVAALSLMVRMRKVVAPSLGIVGGRARLLVMAFSGFAMSVTAGYALVETWGIEGNPTMTIAVASIPAIIALAATGLSLTTGARHGVQAMTGSVVCVVLIGFAWVMLPAATVSLGWLWGWAVTFSVSAAAATWLFREPRWLALSTLPVGIATTLSSPVWLGNQIWSEVGFWNRCIAGEPMLAAAMIAILLGGIRRPWIGYAALLWSGVALSIATVLSVSPESMLGVAPWWSVTVVLMVGALVAAARAIHHHAFAIVTVVVTTVAAVSIFRPWEWDATFETAAPVVWARVALAVAATLLMLGELLTRIVKIDPNNESIGSRARDLWIGSACVAASIGAVIACWITQGDWTTSETILASVIGLLFWSSTLSRSIVPLALCELSTLALAAVIGYGRFNHQLFTLDAFETGAAFFAWAIVGATVVATWLGIRQLATTFNLSPIGRLQHLRKDRYLTRQFPHGWVALMAAVSVAAGSVWSFVSLLSRELNADLAIYDISWGLPVVAFASVGAVVCSMRWQGSDLIDSANEALSGSLVTIVTVSLVTWATSHFAYLMPTGPDVQLVIATSLASFIFLSSTTLRVVDLRLGESSHSSALAATLITVSSVALIVKHWVDPLILGQQPDRFATMAVVIWWSLGSVLLFLRGNQKLEPTSSLASSLLAPAAGVLAVPVFYQSSPIVWLQVAAMVSAAWFALASWLMNREQSKTAAPAISLASVLVMTIGVGSAVIAVMRIVLEMQFLQSAISLPGVCISVIAITHWCIVGLRTGRYGDHGPTRLPWTVGIAVLAGQIGWLASEVGLVSGIHVVELVAAVWLATSVGSLIYHNKHPLAPYQIAGISVLLLIVDWFAGTRSDLTPWLAIAGLSSSGCFIALSSWSSEHSLGSSLAYRMFGWIVVLAGGYLLATRVGLPLVDEVIWTTIIAWAALWVLLWRMLSPDWDNDHLESSAVRRFGPLPDLEFAILLAFVAFCEAILVTLFGNSAYSLGIANPLLMVRMTVLVFVAFSAIPRATRPTVWTLSMTTLLSVVSIVSVQFAIEYGATSGQRIVSALLPAGFMIAFLSHWLSPVAVGLGRLLGGSAGAIDNRLVEATWQSAIVVAAMAGFAASVMITNSFPSAEIHLTIVAIALVAWAVAETAQSCNQSALRHAAVTLALLTIGLWASVIPAGTDYIGLMTSTRWLVASVFSIPMALFVFPKLIGSTLTDQWSDAFKRATMIAGVAAGISLVAMLGQEALLRSSSGIEGISSPMVIGVALTLSILSGLAGWVAILSGPTSKWRQRLDLSDQQRVALIYAAQAVGAITWLHLFLCKADWAFIGLRGYWPYIVMGLSFLSVGATQWAQQGGDRVLSRTLKTTALYLPLVPVIGFWLGVSGGEFDWLFDRDKVRYDVLLAIGAAYYVAVSAIWKDAIPRIAAIVLGNAAWWVVLVQQPGWGFLAHPQLWLIPPTVCLLVAAHLFRDRLEPTVASAIRYIATLVIYISSTADMLLQQVGQNISGPIILVLLALAGMAVGVILRVRPFLYLGAIFVFVGVTSMVWHAQTAIDEVWPWWVFGITTGICLLGGLMALEKNKPKLRQYAKELSTWKD